MANHSRKSEVQDTDNSGQLSMRRLASSDSGKIPGDPRAGSLGRKVEASRAGALQRFGEAQRADRCQGNMLLNKDGEPPSLQTASTALAKN